MIHGGWRIVVGCVHVVVVVAGGGGGRVGGGGGGWRGGVAWSHPDR